MKYEGLITGISALLISGLLIMFAMHRHANTEERYYEVYVPAMDETFECLQRSHNIHSFRCKMPNGDEITIRGTYIIRR